MSKFGKRGTYSKKPDSKLKTLGYSLIKSEKEHLLTYRRKTYAKITYYIIFNLKTKVCLKYKVHEEDGKVMVDTLTNKECLYIYLKMDELDWFEGRFLI